MALADEHCRPMRPGESPLSRAEAEALLSELASDWSLDEQGHLQRSFRFATFGEAFAFVGRAADVAEAEDHHPDVCFGWGWARLTIWTHSVQGLSRNDFILAARLDQLIPEA